MARAERIRLIYAFGKSLSRPPRGVRKEKTLQARRKGSTMFCNGCNNNSALWIIILIIILFGCGGCGGNSYGYNNCGCGCNNNCGCGCNDNCGCC